MPGAALSAAPRGGTHGLHVISRRLCSEGALSPLLSNQATDPTSILWVAAWERGSQGTGNRGVPTQRTMNVGGTA